MEKNKQSEEKNQGKHPEMSKEELREATRTFLRVKKRVEQAKAKRNEETLQ